MVKLVNSGPSPWLPGLEVASYCFLMIHFIYLVCVCTSMCRSQRATCGRLFSSTIWVLGIELWLSGSMASAFNPRGHLTGPFFLLCVEGPLSISLEKKDGSVGFLIPLTLALVTQTFGLRGCDWNPSLQPLLASCSP